MGGGLATDPVCIAARCAPVRPQEGGLFVVIMRIAMVTLFINAVFLASAIKIPTKIRKYKANAKRVIFEISIDKFDPLDIMSNNNLGGRVRESNICVG